MQASPRGVVGRADGDGSVLWIRDGVLSLSLSSSWATSSNARSPAGRLVSEQVGR